VISLIKNLIPDMVRIPSFIVVIASFVTLLQMVFFAAKASARPSTIQFTTINGMKRPSVAYSPGTYGMLVFVLAPGAFIALGYLIALINSFKKA